MNGKLVDCADLEDLLPLHAVEEASVEEALRIEDHVGRCSACRETLGFYRTIRETARESLQDLPAPPAPADRQPAAIARRWIPRLAAAAALLVVGIAAGRWSAPVSPGPAVPPPGAAVAVARLPEAGMPQASRRPVLSVFSPAVRDRLERAARVTRQARPAE